MRTAAAEPERRTAPTAGKVTSVHVTPGDVATGGSVLGTLEAMKTKHAVTAPED